MKKQIKNLMVLSLAIIVLLFGLVFSAKAVNLKSAFGTQLDTVGNRSGFNTSQKNIEPIIGNIISVALSFLGVIFLILMIYGGYMWMTAAGNEEKAKKARQLIQAAVLGLVVVVGAYAITFFILTRLTTGLISSGGGIGTNGVGDANDPNKGGAVVGCCVTPNSVTPPALQTYECQASTSQSDCEVIPYGALIPDPNGPTFYSTSCSQTLQCQPSTNKVVIKKGCCVNYPDIQVPGSGDPDCEDMPDDNQCRPPLVDVTFYKDVSCAEVPACQGDNMGGCCVNDVTVIPQPTTLDCTYVKSSADCAPPLKDPTFYPGSPCTPALGCP